jgi:hypothetical protein
MSCIRAIQKSGLTNLPRSSELTNLHNSIYLPRRIQPEKLNIQCEQDINTNYNIVLSSPTFDPTMESSPPNTFMQNLHERMNVYHNYKDK